jgi:hypothetical protein
MHCETPSPDRAPERHYPGVGAGSFEEVFEDTFHNTKVAIAKMCQGSMVDTLVQLGRHPPLLRMLGFVVDGDHEFIVMEFAMLGSLHTFVDPDDGPGRDMSPPHERTILNQV